MGHTRAQEGLRALGAATGSTALTTALGGQLPHHLGAASGIRPPVEAFVLAGVLVVGAVAAAALSLGCWAIVLAAVARATGRRAAGLERAAAALTPAVLRRMIAAGVGVGLGLAGATTASAVETDLGWVPTGTTAAPAATVAPADGTATPRPAAPASPTAPPAAPAPSGTGAEPAPLLVGASSAPATPPSAPEPAPSLAAPTAGAGTVVVRPGDTLWDLAAARLGGSPTNAAVQDAWPQWYAANRDVIGVDPDVLRPGQVLVVPDGPEVGGTLLTADGVDR